MKKRIFTLAVALVATLATFAEEPRRNFINYDNLKADNNGENSASTIDLSMHSTFKVSNDDDFNLSTSLAIENWKVKLASSARTSSNMNNSYTREVVTDVPVDLTLRDPSTTSRTVMGVRIAFPRSAINSYADVMPPFNIPVWAGNNDNEKVFQEEGFGVIMNMGVLKEVTVRVCGRNSSHRLQALVEIHGKSKILDLGTLDFVGWKDLTWTNPNYIVDVQDRDIDNEPLYPGDFPYAKFLGFRIIKDIDYTGGDFVFYLDSVSAIYDVARPIQVGDTINDEEIWGIEQNLQKETENVEFLQIGKRKTLEYFEEKRIDRSASQPKKTTGAGNNSAGQASDSPSTGGETVVVEDSTTNSN